METRPYNHTEKDPPPLPPPLPEVTYQPSEEVDSHLPDEVDDEEIRISPEKLAWVATHRKEALDSNESVKAHFNRVTKMAEENEAIEDQYEKRAEKRADDSSSPKDEEESATQVGEIVRKQNEEFANYTEPYPEQPSRPEFNHQATAPSQADDSQQDEDDEAGLSISKIVTGELFAIYKKYIVAGFFFGVVLLVAMLIIWLVIG